MTDIIDRSATFPTLPAWGWMWMLTALVFYSGKALLYARSKQRPRGWRRLAWWVWPGMDTAPWGRHDPVTPPRPGEWTAALLKTALGAGLVWGVARRVEPPLAADWIAMTGLILLLHFGSFHLMALGLRALGVGVRPLMDAPLNSRSLAEFWGRRWNRGFTDLMTPLVFRPVARRWGAGTAMGAVFLISGLAHELVISLPAGGGWGLPSGYFLLQGAGLAIERRWRVLRHPLPARMWTLAITAAPAFWLFHPPFVRQVMRPFFQALGAL